MFETNDNFVVVCCKDGGAIQISEIIVNGNPTKPMISIEFSLKSNANQPGGYPNTVCLNSQLLTLHVHHLHLS